MWTVRRIGNYGYTAFYSAYKSLIGWRCDNNSLCVWHNSYCFVNSFLSNWCVISVSIIKFRLNYINHIMRNTAFFIFCRFCRANIKTFIHKTRICRNYLTVYFLRKLNRIRGFSARCCSDYRYYFNSRILVHNK